MCSQSGQPNADPRDALGKPVDAEQAIMMAFAANVPHVSPNLNKTFYENGGDSIAFLGFISEFSRLIGKELPFESIDLECPLSELLTLSQIALDPTLPKTTPEDVGELSLTGNRLAYLLPMAGDIDRWVHVSRVFDCHLKYDRAHIDAAFQAIFNAHIGLSLRFKPNCRALRQELFARNGEWILERECPRELNSDEAKRFARAIVHDARFKISIFETPLLVVVISHAAAPRFWLIILTHHALVDGLAVQVVHRDFAIALEQVYAGKTPRITSTSASISQYMRAYETFCRSTQSASIAYWRQLPWRAAAPIPLSRPNLVAHLDEIATHEISASAARDDVRRLEAKLATTSGPTLVSLLASALARAYGKWVNQEFLYLAFVVHGRANLPNCPPLHETVGWLSDTVPLFIPTRGSLDQIVKSAHEQIVYATSSGGISYNYLRYVDSCNLPQWRKLDSAPPMFSLNVRIGGVGRRTIPDFLSFFPMSLRPLGRRVFQMSGGAVLGQRNLRLSLDFNSVTLDREFVSQLLENWVSECESIFYAFGGAPVEFSSAIELNY